jgi:hypothetical protein
MEYRRGGLGEGFLDAFEVVGDRGDVAQGGGSLVVGAVKVLGPEVVGVSGEALPVNGDGGVAKVDDGACE